MGYFILRLRFEPNLDYQLKAVDAVCELFQGQESFGKELVGVDGPLDANRAQLLCTDGIFAVSNPLTLDQDAILCNLKDVQMRNGLAPSKELTTNDFTVEMETGTGKTYVYLRTVFELNKRFGFTKFVVVVPSIAIKEGVYKSLQMMEEHFRAHYSGKPFEYFLYDSSKLWRVRSFTTSPHIQIMVVTVGSINKRDINNLYKDHEITGGERPLDFIRATRPILIVDEPQSVDGGLSGQGRRALSAMNSLCTLRYSATHINTHHMVYRLDAVDAYQLQLVKQIEVAGATVEDDYNRPYVHLISANNRRGSISAQVELDVESAGRVKRMVRTVYDGVDLEKETGRAIYQHFRIGEIRVADKDSFVEIQIPGGTHFLKTGESWGDVGSGIQREMIRRTIREHLEKEKRLLSQGIKVLSLFFIDSVERYRSYDQDGRPVKGEYATIFEEEYHRFTTHPEFETLFAGIDPLEVVEKSHDGYFSIDRKGGWTNTAENNRENRENAERAYNLIMRDKEKLLSLDTPLKFIFSHSALREGWDNPNIFQICALREVHSVMGRRQMIGRGLRLCVDQFGKRVRGSDTNTLTVIARENFEQFAIELQREIEEDTGICFGVIEPHQFAHILLSVPNENKTTFGYERSERLYNYLYSKNYIDAAGRIQDNLQNAINTDSLELPSEFEPLRQEIVSRIMRVARRLEFKNADERQIVRPRQTILQSKEFKALWERIKYKTKYRVSFNNKLLLEQSVLNLKNAPTVPRTRLQWRKADIEIDRAGVEATQSTGSSTVVLNEPDVQLPNLLSELQDRTQLTRRSILKVLVDSGRLNEFIQNPQQFIESVTQTINGCKQKVLIDGIKYQRIGDESYYAQELFEQEELTGYLKNMLMCEKSVHERVIYESNVEANFAADLERDFMVKFFVKLPRWFTVPTPLGNYNPDWAIQIERDDGKRLYFVVETKGSTHRDNLRFIEAAKAECGKAHFEALGNQPNPARYEIVSSVSQLLANSIES